MATFLIRCGASFVLFVLLILQGPMPSAAQRKSDESKSAQAQKKQDAEQKKPNGKAPDKRQESEKARGLRLQRSLAVAQIIGFQKPSQILSASVGTPKTPGSRGTEEYWDFWAEPFLRAVSGVQLVGFRQPLHILAAYNGTYKDFLIWGVPEQPEPKIPFKELIKETIPERGTREYWKFWSKKERRVAARHAQLLGLRDPLFIVAAKAGSSYAPNLTREWLLTGVQVRDDMPFPHRGNRDKFNKAEKNEIKALVEALTNAAFTPEENFARSAKGNEHLNWGVIFAAPSSYRGKVIPMKGSLRRLRKLPAPYQLVHRGIPFVYEGWVFTATYGSNPLCVLFIRLPEGVAIGEKIEHEVTFNGYFFKRYKYYSSKGWKRTLHFVAPTFETKPKPEDTGLSDLITKVFAFLAFFGVITAVGLGIVRVWYLMHDAKVRNRISKAKEKLVDSPFDDQPSESPPMATRVTAEEPKAAESEGNGVSGHSTSVTGNATAESPPRFQFPDEQEEK